MHTSHFLNMNRDQMKAGQTKKITLGIPNGVNSLARPQYRRLFVVLSWKRCIKNCNVDSFDQFSVKTILSDNFEDNCKFLV